MKRTTTIAVGSLIFVGLAFFSGNASAQQGHAHESPHGGQVLTMGDHHVEFLVVEGEHDKDFIIVYLLDKNLAPVSVDKVEGLVYLTLPDKSKQTLELTATTEIHRAKHDEEAEHDKEEEHVDEKEHVDETQHEHEGLVEKMLEEEKEKVLYFMAEVNLKDIDTFDAVVSLKMGEKRNNLRFKYVRDGH